MTFCLFGEGCCVYDRVSRIPGFSAGKPICAGCRERAISLLQKLRLDYVDLSQLIPKSDARNEQGKIFRPKPESSAPINMAAFTLRGEIAYLLALSERVVRRLVGDSQAAQRLPVREGFALDAAVRYLQVHAEDFAAMPAEKHYWRQDDLVLDELSGLDVLARLQSLHTVARKMCGTEPRTMTVPGMCPSCQVPSLRRSDDNRNKIWCIHCSLAMNEATYLQAQRNVFAPHHDQP